MGSALRAPGSGPSPLLGIIAFVIVTAAVSGAGFWLLQSEPSMPRSITTTVVASRNTQPRKQYFRTLDSETPDRQSTRSTRRAAPERQPAALSQEPVIPSAPPRNNTPARRSPPPEQGASTTLADNAPGASDSPQVDVTEGPVYSANDAEVVPPRLEIMQSVSPAPVEEDPGAPITIEVVVSETGTVDSVKSTVIPDTLGKSIWMTNSLSVVKTWQFRPASKDGQPVKYRLFLPLGGN